MMLRKEALLCSKTGGAGVRVTVAMNDTGSSRNVGYCKGDGENPAYGNISSEELAGVPIWQISSMTKNGSGVVTNQTALDPSPESANPVPALSAVTVKRLDTGYAVRLTHNGASGEDKWNIAYVNISDPGLFTEADVGKTIEITLVPEWA